MTGKSPQLNHAAVRSPGASQRHANAIPLTFTFGPRFGGSRGRRVPLRAGGDGK